MLDDRERAARPGDRRASTGSTNGCSDVVVSGCQLCDLATRAFHIEASIGIVVHQSCGDGHGLQFCKQAVIDFGLQRAIQPASHLDRISSRARRPTRVTSEAEEFVGWDCMYEPTDKVGRGEGID